MVGYIYRITNKVTGQHYIGQTVDINRRKRTHFNSLKRQDHDNPKLQASWNKYGEDNFEFESWEFQIDNLEQLNELECSYIDKYEGLTMGFNLVPGGGRPPLHQKVKDDDVATFLCVQKKLGDGYGKTCEQIFGWSKGTASAAKRKIRYLNGWNIYESMSSEEQDLRAQDFIESQHLKEQALKRQLTQGGCEKAYQLTQDDFNFTFTAQSLGYSYTPVANYLGIKPATVKDWFNGRSRSKERELYIGLSDEKHCLYIKKVKNAQLERYAHDKFINKNEQDVINYLCYCEFYPINDAQIERLYGWAASTCHNMRLPNTYPMTKAKIKIMSEDEKRGYANNLNNQLIGRVKIAELSGNPKSKSSS